MTRASRLGAGAFAVAGIAGATALVWGTAIERYVYTLRRAELAILPAGAAPVRVLHLSDIHMAPWQRRKQRWIASLVGLRPDLIINTGDNLGHAEGLAGVRAALEPFAGTPGVFVHGSNDMLGPAPRNPFRYFLGPSGRRPQAEKLDTAAMERFFVDELGWHDLNNRVAHLRVGGATIRAIGTGDAHHKHDDLDALDAVAAQARDSGDAASSALTIGVTHAPYRRILDALLARDADALFAGHTHGGQVRVPGYGALVANCDIPLRQARGLSTWTSGDRSVPLNVSAGIGHSIYAPVRFACPPEATLITLTARA
ncbi:MAG: metallophosphatase [Microbacterium sp.]|uniref:metallophosphoesterase n=1 Tax=unclassified Microbacterium TaxID=2609290 RepID=UPI000DB013FD|nr:metallophosphoesterase [Microbacterium sp.]PZU38808.1 MAG: metallophosphatase [Microbacterium sp.]